MIVQIFAVFDAKAKAFQVPFYAQSEVLAMRTVRAALQGDHMLAKFPEDFSVYHLGQYDDESGVIEAVTPSVSFMVGSLVIETLSGGNRHA